MSFWLLSASKRACMLEEIPFILSLGFALTYI